MKDFRSLAVPGVQSLKPYIPGKPIEELERELGVKNSLKLASNENPLGASPRVNEVLRDFFSANPTAISLYPDGNGFVLKNKLAETLAVDVRQITLGNGSNDVLDMIARVFLGPGREAVISRYAFAVYPISSQAVGATLRIAEALPADHTDNPFGHDLDAMLEQVNDKTGVVFIANPNNPTGTWVNRDELQAFLERVPQNVIVVVDEAYFEYVSEPDYPNALKWLEQFPNLIVTRTFSKIHGLASLRIGYALSHPEIADLLNRVRQPFNVNTPALLAATTALEDTQFAAKCADLNQKGLKFWRAACQYRGLDYIPSVGNFITVDMGRSAAPLYDALLREAVIVRPVANYGLPDHLRITISTPEQNQRCLDALERVLGQESD